MIRLNKHKMDAWLDLIFPKRNKSAALGNLEQVKKTRLEYKKEYRQKHKEKIAESNRIYHEKNREYLNNKRHEYYMNNIEELKAKGKRYYQIKKSKIAEKIQN